LWDSMISIRKNILEEVRRHAVESYPHECCGVIIGHPQNREEDIIYPCTNIQNQLHEQDPENYPRDAKTAFNIDSAELLKIENEARNRGMVIRTFYHSHPEHEAYFSEEDEKQALFGDEPWYPDANHLVISVYNRQVKNQALFAWHSEKKVFERQKDLNI
jgi:[CysO sulfur-carrier protein]-S-L-cysteine hydrolase